MLILADDSGLSLGEMTLRVGLSLALGGVIGANRQLHRKPAGLRTMMLVCVGSCAAVLAGVCCRNLNGGGMSSADISRIIQGIVGGIGFLGAGVIIHENMWAAGVTTAAAIWATAALGVGLGLGEYRLSAVVWVGVMLTLTLIGRIEYMLFKDKGQERQAEHTPPEAKP